MLNSRDRTTTLLAAFIGTAMAFIPWPDIFLHWNGLPMIDRAVYEGQLADYNLRSDYFDYTSLSTYVFEEALWNRGLAFFSRDIGLFPSTIFFIITLAYMVTTCIFVAHNASIPYLSLLINPLVVDLAWSQLRLALALALLSLPLIISRMHLLLKLAICVTAPFIHTAALLFILVYSAANYTGNVVGGTSPQRAKAAAALIAVGLAIALAIGPLREVILARVGDRRAIYPDMSTSIRYLSFWVFMFGVMLYRYRDTTQFLTQRVSLVLLTIVVLSTVFGGTPLRFLAAAFPFLVSSMAQATGLTRLYLVLPFLLYTIIQWAYWLNVL